jgi:hypothetical protein
MRWNEDGPTLPGPDNQFVTATVMVVLTRSYPTILYSGAHDHDAHFEKIPNECVGDPMWRSIGHALRVLGSAHGEVRFSQCVGDIPKIQRN